MAGRRSLSEYTEAELARKAMETAIQRDEALTDAARELADFLRELSRLMDQVSGAEGR